MRANTAAGARSCNRASKSLRHHHKQKPKMLLPEGKCECGMTLQKEPKQGRNTSLVGHHKSCCARPPRLLGREQPLGIPKRDGWRRKPLSRKGLLRPRTSRQASLPAARKTCMPCKSKSVKQDLIIERTTHPWTIAPIVPYCHQGSHTFSFQSALPEHVVTSFFLFKICLLPSMIWFGSSRNKTMEIFPCFAQQLRTENWQQPQQNCGNIPTVCPVEQNLATAATKSWNQRQPKSCTTL